MESLEDVLPFEQSLEGNVADLREELAQLFETTKESNGDIIDADDEMRRDIVMLGKFSDIVGKIVARSEDEVVQASEAVYRSVCFAAAVSDGVLPSTYSCELLGYIQERTSDASDLSPIMEDSQQYLQYRPELDSLIGEYMPDIDRSGRYNHVAELFSTLVFMLSERSIGEQYLQANIDDISPSDFN